MSKNDGGSAFPLAYEQWTSDEEFLGKYVNPGMTLRDYFAASALSGLLANPKYIVDAPHSQVASLVYQQADAMIAERENGGEL